MAKTLPSSKPIPPPKGYRDPSSVSDPSAVYTTHISLDIGVDFEIETLGGTATLTLLIIDESVTYVDLDARGLIVRKVIDADTDLTLQFDLERDVTSIGDRLRITLPRGAGDRGSARVCIYYASRGSGSPAGGACDWTPARDDRNPFLFTQAQAVHARSFLPCQDTPCVKFTYQAVVKVMTPHEDLQVLMGAVPLGKDDDGAYTFIQNVPVPSYLVALAVGDLKEAKISNRCTVWADPDVVEKAKWEFEEVEQFLSSAEKLAGKYVWGVYSLLVLPSSFPYGGMENPCLTFLTPSLLSGDRSLVSVVAHEIAHSWSGNLVTGQDFRHFWLNEGFTVKLERRILRDVYGKEREGLDAHMGRQGLDSFIETVGEDHPYTCLVANLKDGEDPDDAFSCVAYEKGYNFLSYLENLILQEDGASEDAFDEFMKQYFEHYAYQALNSDEFVTFFSEKFPSVAAQVNFDAWLHSPGPCPALAPLDMTLVTAASGLAKRWKTVCTQSEEAERESALRQRFEEEAAAVRGWDPKQKQLFLSEMLALVTDSKCGEANPWWNTVSCALFADMYGFDNARNSEIRFRWCQLGLRGHRSEAVECTKDFLRGIGRMKFVRPLFKDLHTVYPKGDVARTLFAEVKQGYHDICVKMVSRDLGVAAGSAAEA